jgi:outer membrane receptor protein involved in Fe transport
VRGNISGEVTDPSGAVVKGASVRLVNVATGQTLRTVQTGDDGVYQFLEIEPATYNVVVSAGGFAEATLTEAKVEPNRNLRLDVALSVGGTTETVEVTASQELVDRESATLGTTVDRRRVQGLPLNGRNVLDLALLQPGVLPAGAGFGAGLGIRVNGQRGVENNLTLDGANNNEIAVGGGLGAQPRPDAVEEFRLLTSNYEAEFGRNTGSVINVVTRSGTNDFHGNARIFYRPTFLSAARYFDKAISRSRPLTEEEDENLKRRFERKEFGGNIGGPVWIPGLYNGRERTFFFVDYEGRRQLIGDTRTITGLPSAAERMGDFSQLGRVIRDPATGDPFPGNRIPTSRFSPIANYYLQFLPIPDAEGRAVVSADEITNFDQLVARGDHNLTDSQTINYTLAWFDSAQDTPFAFGGASVPGFGSQNLRTTHNHVFRHTYAISPTLVNYFLAGYGRNNQPGVSPQNSTTPAEIGFTANFVANPALAGPPYVRLLDRGILLGNSIQGPQTRVSENFQIQDSVSWATGSHRFKFGIDGTFYKQDQIFLFVNQAIISFTSTAGGNTTGDDLADLLIGNSPVAMQFGANGERDFRQKGFAWFAQDTWRVTSDLTLSLGVRYEYVSPLTDKYNRVAYYREGAVSQILTSGQLVDPSSGVPIVVPPGGRAPVGLVYPGDPDPVLGGTVPDGGVDKDFNNFGPRLGIAWSPSTDEGLMRTLLGEQDTVIRAGFGVYYGAVIGDTILQSLSAPGYNGTNAFFFPASGTLADPFAPDPFPDFRGDQGQIPNPFASSQFFITAPLTQFSRPINPRIRTPYTYQYNFTVERSFFDSYVASVSYVGTRGLKLYALEQINPALGTFFPAPPGRQIPVPTQANANSRRLNDDIRLGLSELGSAGNSWYNALEVNFQRQYTNGLLFQVAYTYSKSISDSDTLRDTLDRLDRRAGRSLSAQDIPHRFVASWLYDLPFANNLDGVGEVLLDGWGIGGIYTYQSGNVFSVANPFDTVGTGGGVLSLADLGDGYQQLDPRENDNRAFNVDAFRIFGDPATGFNVATDFRRGTSSYNQFRLNNPINNWDLNIYKKTQLWNETANLELRFEMFNALNHAQFLGPDATGINLNLLTVTRNADGAIDPLRSSFGKYIAAREARVIQLAARISF